MIRQSLSPRPDWQAKVEALGLIWHDGGDRPYWDESACYRFTRAQVDSIESATAELYRLFLAAGEAVSAIPRYSPASQSRPPFTIRFAKLGKPSRPR